MKTKVEVKNVIRLELHNRCHWHGCYDDSDDWQIVVFGDTYEEAIEAAAQDPLIADLFQPSAYIYTVTVLVWTSPDDEQFIVQVDGAHEYCCRKFKSPECPPNASEIAWRRITATHAYKLAVRRERDAKRREKAQERKEHEQEERAKLARLRKKYPRRK